MKLITRDTDYAVRALCCIAKDVDKVVSATDLVKCLKIPRPFLRKILQILNNEGILISAKGKGGGFALAKIPERIFLIDLIKIFHGDFRLNECFFKKRVCPNIKACPLKKEIDLMQKYVVNRLSCITIASLLRKSKNVK